MASAAISRDTNYLIVDTEGNICIDQLFYPSYCVFDHDLKEKIRMLFEQNRNYLYENSSWNKLLILVEDVRRLSKILCGKDYVISTKSDYFKSINRNIEIINYPYKNKHELPQYKSRAQLVLFNDGTIAITVPNQIQKIGGFKKLRLALLIPKESPPLFARISKIRKDKRDIASLKNFDGNVEKITHVRSEHLSTPIFSYNHPKKGIEFIYRDCETDLFDYLFPFSNFAFKGVIPNKELAAKLSRCLKTSVFELISILKQMVLPLKDLYDHGFLHGDIKAENYLITKDSSDRIKILLADFDFVCAHRSGVATAMTYGGTLRYYKPTASIKNLESELYALAMSFKFMATDDKLITSVWDAFYYLNFLARRNKDPIVEKINAICCMIEILVDKMKKGRDDVFPSYDEILYDIQNMEDYLLTDLDSAI